jgi:predicted dehydrogenase
MPTSSPAPVSPSTRTFGFGLIGVGMIADFHAQAIAGSVGGRLVGVASRNGDAARAFAAKHGATHVTTDVGELVARPDIDVVCITTPSGAHREPALAAIAAGKHVVIEKPIEITLERADDILAAAEARGVQVAPIFQARFGDGAKRVKAAIDAGRLGRVVLASAYVKWHRPAAYYQGWKGTRQLDGGGALINQGIHAVDLLQWFAGMPQRVFGFRTRRVHTRIEEEDTVTAALNFRSGALGAIEATTAAWPGWRRRLEIAGETGSIALEDDTITRWEFREPQPEDAAVLASASGGAPGSGASAPNAISVEGHRRQIQDLIDGLRDGRRLAIDGREARKALALVRAVYTSADSGRAVELAG